VTPGGVTSASGPPGVTTCLAGATAMRFSPNGDVHACCVNKYQLLGRVGSQGLREIWHGAPRLALAAALEVGDYSLGCHECEREHVVGNRLLTHAEQFDRFAGQPDSDYPRRIEFALSNACNLQCIMCGGDLSSSIRAHRERLPPLPRAYGEEFFEQLDEFLPHLEVAVFIGGEPFLSTEARRIWDRMLELDLDCEVHVTTNATIWNDTVRRYVSDLRMNVAVSIDALTAELNDHIRVGSDVTEVLANSDRLHRITTDTGRAFTINHCLLTENWRHLGEFLIDAERRMMDVHVITVSAPARLSLLELPLPELEQVVAELERQNEAVAPMLDRNSASWSTTVAHLRNHLERVDVQETRVGLTSHPTRRRSADELWEELATELAQLTGRDTLAVDDLDGVVVDVQVPDWAEALGASSWVGLRTNELFSSIATRLGPAGEAQLTKPHPEITRIEIGFGSDDALSTLVVLRREHATVGPGTGTRYLLNTADELHLSSDETAVDRMPVVRVLPSAYS